MRTLFTLLLMVISLLPATGLQAATIITDPNTTDTPLFIQLLGINNAGTIVGYTGMGTPNPNRGFVLTLPNSFTPLNPNLNPVTCICQVQVFGITNAGTTRMDSTLMPVVLRMASSMSKMVPRQR